MDYAFLEHAEDFLPRSGGHLLVLTGTGDLAGLSCELAGFYRRLGLPVVLTGTVGMEAVPGFTRIPGSDAGSLKATDAVQIMGDPDRGLTPDKVDELVAAHDQGIVLCVADAPTARPLKLYRHDPEPWPRLASLSLVLMGGQAVGAPAGEVLEGLGSPGARPRTAAALAGHELLLWEHMDDLLLGEGGYLDQVPADIPAVLGITGLEEVADSIGLFGFVGRAMGHPRLPLVMFCSRGEDGMQLRTAFRTAAGEGEP